MRWPGNTDKLPVPGSRSARIGGECPAPSIDIILPNFAP